MNKPSLHNNIHTARIIFTFILAFILLGFTSCISNSDTLYFRYQSISADGWKKTDTVVFELSDSMICGKCKTEIGIRHTESYPYRDIWVELSYPIINTEKTDNRYINSDSIDKVAYINERITEERITEEKDIEEKIRYKTDTLHLYLANERGNWNGNGTTGGYYQFVAEGPVIDFGLYNKHHSNINNDTITVIRINHIMADKVLKNITDIGIRIIKE